MSTEKKPTNFKISPWWIYGALIGIFLLLSLLNGGSFQDPQKITSSKSEELLNKGQIEKVIIFNKVQAEIYLTPAALYF
jgi:cell division protease FtsH